MKSIVMLGPPGSGKGTQAELISKRYGIPAISTGDIFRQNLSEETELGKKASEYMKKGELVPDALVIDIVIDRLSKDDTKTGYLLDGFPRTTAQADAFEKLLGENGSSIDYVIYINIPKDELIRRVVSRRVCGSCGKTYNVNSFPPKTEGVCDVCGGDVVQRADDTEETANNRIDVYNEQTTPLIEYYKGKGVLYEFNGMDEVEAINDRINALIG